MGSHIAGSGQEPGMNKCERCSREFRTIQELRGHQQREDIGLDLHRAWTFLSSHFIAIAGAIIGGTIGLYSGIYCGYLLFYCGIIGGSVGGVIGGAIGNAIDRLLFRILRLLFRQRVDPSGEDRAGCGCLGFLGIGFLGAVAGFFSLWIIAAIFW